MNTLNRFKAPFVVAVALAIPVVTNGCSAVEDAQGAVCCTEFKAGGSIKIEGSANAQVAAQAVADFTGIASAAISDLTTACRAIAIDLGASQADQDAANAQTDANDQMKSWCTAAASAIGNVRTTAGVSLALTIEPPQCNASFSAKANCQAKCSGSAKCDVKADPPKCSGGPGSLSISCKGSCTAEATATVKCQGSCKGSCKGSCTAKGGVAVKCEGKCEGTCTAEGGGGNNGVQADGSCKGSCQGTCTASATAPALDCSGSCDGECSASCDAEAGASVTCNGKCSTPDFEPIKCEGGQLSGGCKVEASCDANCDASVQAKAECTPPKVSFSFTAAANADAAAKLKATLEANLPLILAFKAKLEAMGKIGATLTSEASVKAVGELKASCILAIGLAASRAVTKDIPDSVSATLSISGELK